jgi:hypothetical protein
VVAISPGIFKIPLPQPVSEGFQVLRWQDLEGSTRERDEAGRLLDHRTALLAESLALAKRLACLKVIIVGIVRPPAEQAMLPLIRT